MKIDDSACMYGTVNYALNVKKILLNFLYVRVSNRQDSLRYQKPH